MEFGTDFFSAPDNSGAAAAQLEGRRGGAFRGRQI